MQVGHCYKLLIIINKDMSKIGHYYGADVYVEEKLKSRTGWILNLRGVLSGNWQEIIGKVAPFRTVRAPLIERRVMNFTEGSELSVDNSNYQVVEGEIDKIEIFITYKEH